MGEGQPARLRVTFIDDQAMEVPMSDQIALVLNAGGWLAREYIARVFETDLGAANMVSRRIRKIQI
jgi:hypothetical protein